MIETHAVVGWFGSRLQMRLRAPANPFKARPPQVHLAHASFAFRSWDPAPEAPPSLLSFHPTTMESEVPVAHFSKVGVVVKTGSREAANLARQLILELERLDIEPIVDEESAPKLGRESSIDRSSLAGASDLVIVLGGDGTLLSVTRGELGTTPILGINLGTLGFLTEHPVDRLFPMLKLAIEGGAKVEIRERLEIEVNSPGKKEVLRRALNDVVINKSALARMILLSVHVNGEFLSRFRADGLILATPTGSTAYNLSAGGPIIYPTVRVVLVTPICPHTLTNRPIALPLDSEIEIRLESRSEEVYLTLDGQEGFPLSSRDLLRIRRCPEPVRLLTDPGRSYFHILHRKLKWGQRGG